MVCVAVKSSKGVAGRADLLVDPSVVRREMVPCVAEGTSPERSIEVALRVGVQDRSTLFAQHWVIRAHLHKKHRSASG